MPPETFLLPLESCSDPILVGGKAAGLGRLIRSGFRVPGGLCVTTAAFHETLRAAGIDVAGQWKRLMRASDGTREAMLDQFRDAVSGVSLHTTMRRTVDEALDRLGLTPDTLWAVRSSAPDEDAAEATYGGLHRTILGVGRPAIAAAIVECWASVWSSAAAAYRRHRSRTGAPPAMAVVLQPRLAPRAAGVAYSRHPVTRSENCVVINAVFGLGEPLVAGGVTPD